MLSPNALEAEPDNSIELIVANSVIQYLTPAEFDHSLALWRRLLTPNGTLIVADVIPPGVGTATDVTALLRYAARNGFLLAALAGLARTALSPYRKLRRTIGIAQYTQGEFLEKLAAAGYVAERLPYNFEHNPGRTEIPGILKCFSQRPDFLRDVMESSYRVHFSEGHLTRRVKEMIATYVSALNQCPY